MGGLTLHGPEDPAPAPEWCTEWCAECGVPLAPSACHTLTAERHPHVDSATHLLAGSGVSAEFCRDHAPEGALAPT